MSDHAVTLRDAEPADREAICQLNRMDEARLSPMDIDRFNVLSAIACYCKVATVDDTLAGFLMGFANGTDYESVNYRWFNERMKAFFYIDRVVVDARFRKMGIASAFYRDVQAFAHTTDLPWLAAEIDLQPPNTSSLAFHKAFGFNEIGTQVYGEGRMVSLQLGPVPPA
ncbi:MAG: GNAT family N-acetyltransferase [Pseudomonadota bacterium]